VENKVNKPYFLCGGTLRVIADVTDPDAIQTILAHLRQRAPPDAVQARAAKRSLCRYLMVKTTAAHFSLRQQKIMLANRPSPGQPITTKNLVAFNHYSSCGSTLS
jgi:hypothetical protein